MRRSSDLPTSLAPYAVISAALGGFGMALFQPVPATGVADARGLATDAVIMDQPTIHAPLDRAPAAPPEGCSLVVEVSTPGATVMVQRSEAPDDKRQLRLLDTEVRATFDALAVGDYDVTVGGIGVPLTGAQPFACTAHEHGYRKVIVSDVAHRVTGRVLGHRGLVPGGVAVVLEQPDGDKDASAGAVHLPVDGEGVFDVLLPEGRYELIAAAPHHRALRQSIDVGDRMATVLRLHHEPHVRGVVVNAKGEPLPGAEVFLNTGLDPRLSQTRVIANDEGEFDLPAHSEGWVRLSARAETAQGGFVGEARLPRIRTLEGVSDAKIVVHAGRQIRGYVQTRTGRLKPHATVRYRSKDLGITGTVTADAEGKFVVEGMPRADVELWAEGSAVGAWGGAVATARRSKVLLTWVPPAYKKR